MAKGLRPVYTAVNEAQAAERFEEFAATWEPLCPAAIRMWRSAWSEFVPFLDHDVEIRKVICTTNAIESLNAWFRAATRRRGHFPDEDAALKVLYLAVRKHEPNRPNPTGTIHGWKGILNVLSMTYSDRLGVTRQDVVDAGFEA